MAALLGRRSATRLLSEDETRRIAVNIAKLPGKFLPELYYRLMKPRGLYRERNCWGNQDSARVKYDEHQELDVSEDTYRARDYQPPFDELPLEG